MSKRGVGEGLAADDEAQQVVRLEAEDRGNPGRAVPVLDWPASGERDGEQARVGVERVRVADRHEQRQVVDAVAVGVAVLQVLALDGRPAAHRRAACPDPRRSRRRRRRCSARRARRSGWRSRRRTRGCARAGRPCPRAWWSRAPGGDRPPDAPAMRPARRERRARPGRGPPLRRPPGRLLGASRWRAPRQPGRTPSRRGSRQAGRRVRRGHSHPGASGRGGRPPGGAGPGRAPARSGPGAGSGRGRRRRLPRCPRLMAGRGISRLTQ